MAWQGIEGHDKNVRRFQQALERGRLAGSFLFVGPAGIGKRSFAVALARGLLCKGNGDASVEPCGNCDSCRLFVSSKTAENEEAIDVPYVSPHPDLYYISKPVDKSDLPLELLIGGKERRGHSGLCYDISRTPFLGHRKVAIIDDADFFNVQGANALLKTLEEPPPDAVLILIATSAANLLPTIRSRCQTIRFLPLAPKMLASILFEQDRVASLEQGLRLARQADGTLNRARELLDESLEPAREEVRKMLSHKSLNATTCSATILAEVEKAGKEAPPRRRRLRLLLGTAIDYFRDRLRNLEKTSHDVEARSMMLCLERTIAALEQVDRNANQNFLVESWCDDLKTLRSE